MRIAWHGGNDVAWKSLRTRSKFADDCTIPERRSAGQVRTSRKLTDAAGTVVPCGRGRRASGRKDCRMPVGRLSVSISISGGVKSVAIMRRRLKRFLMRTGAQLQQLWRPIFLIAAVSVIRHLQTTPDLVYTHDKLRVWRQPCDKYRDHCIHLYSPYRLVVHM